MARNGKDQPVPTSAWSKSFGKAPRLQQALDEIAGFLLQLGYDDAREALQRQAEKQGVQIKSTGKGRAVSKNALMRRWHTADEVEAELNDSEDEAEEGALVDDIAGETSDDDSDGSSDSGASVKAGQKRKRVLTPESSDDEDSDSGSDISMKDDAPSAKKSSGSDSESSSSSSEDERPAKKRSKVAHGSKKSASPKSRGSSSSSSSSDSSSSDSSSSDSDGSAASSKSASSSSSNSSSSDSEGSSSSSSSSTDSDSDSERGKKKKKHKEVKKSKKAPKKEDLKKMAPTEVKLDALNSTKPGSSTSSATLEADSAVEIKDTLIIPASETKDNTAKEVPATKENIKKLKKQAVPFSRIPADQKVDPRFASNDYVSYDYADRAYQDLVVTKGKGFTKEKNKKKRGAYRGGAIDLTPKGIKFDD